MEAVGDSPCSISFHWRKQLCEPKPRNHRTLSYPLDCIRKDGLSIEESMGLHFRHITHRLEGTMKPTTNMHKLLSSSYISIKSICFDPIGTIKSPTHPPFLHLVKSITQNWGENVSAGRVPRSAAGMPFMPFMPVEVIFHPS